MDVFLMIRRKTTHIFCDAKESTSVLELKRMIQGILKVSPNDQRLYREGKMLDDNHTLADCGFTSGSARAQQPACVGLAIRGEDGAFEPLEISPLSTPPDLPEVMKQTGTEGSSGAQPSSDQPNMT